MNELFGWCWVLAGFLSGAGIGLFFHGEEWLGGYGSFRRRLLRLGHIAFIGLGILNILFAYSQPRMLLSAFEHNLGGVSMIVGGITMPLVCWLSAWRPGFRRLFFIPVVSLVTGVVQGVIGLYRGVNG